MSIRYTETILSVYTKFQDFQGPKNPNLMTLKDQPSSRAFKALNLEKKSRTVNDFQGCEGTLNI